MGVPATIPLATCLTDAEILFPATEVNLPRVLAYTNEKTDASAYAARVAHSPPILLGRLPRGAMLCCGDFRVLLIAGQVITESLPHIMRGNSQAIMQAIIGANNPLDIDEECVSLARYGHGTWGHWLGEILPMAAIVEQRYPGRFRYALPQHWSHYGRTMRESLRAYGIETSRLIPIPWTETVRLNNAWTVSRIWSWTDDAPHPAALSVMRGAVRLSTYRPALERVALMRRDWPTRQINNGAAVETVLRDAGFTITDAATLPFVDQVRMFQSARTIFAVLGSGLTGLIYSRNHVKVLAAGPSCWRDHFFHALAQHRRAIWGEIRGPSLWDGNGFGRDAPFEVPIVELRHAIDLLDATAA